MLLEWRNVSAQHRQTRLCLRAHSLTHPRPMPIPRADITMSPAQEHDPKAREARLVFWRERQAGNGNATNELGLATRSQSVAILPTHTARQIAGIEPWGSGWAQVPGNEAFQGLTDEWTASVAALKGDNQLHNEAGSCGPGY